MDKLKWYRGPDELTTPEKILKFIIHVFIGVWAVLAILFTVFFCWKG